MGQSGALWGIMGQNLLRVQWEKAWGFDKMQFTGDSDKDDLKGMVGKKTLLEEAKKNMEWNSENAKYWWLIFENHLQMVKLGEQRSCEERQRRGIGKTAAFSDGEMAACVLMDMLY